MASVRGTGPGAILLLLALTSCAENPPADDDGAAPATPPSGAPVEETSDMAAEHLSSWDEVEEVSATELQVWFYSGNPSCYGVRSVVEEDDEEIRLATISGTRPEAIDSACTQEARIVSLLVELEEPVGDREVVPLDDVELDR